jgi:twitching motility two-component system response regulator PilG
MKPKIMIIDDSQTIRRSAQLFLQEHPYELIMVENGFDALGEIFSKRPDLIFVDLMMPKLGGYETCQMVKTHPEFKDIPIIFLSSKDGMFDKARGKMVGGDEYLTKPFSSEGLLSMIKRFLPQ